MADKRPICLYDGQPKELRDGDAIPSHLVSGLGSAASKNITLSTQDPPAGQGSEGDIWIKYTL